MTRKRVLLLLPVYVILMSSFNVVFRSLKIDSTDLPAWLMVGFILSAVFSLLVLLAFLHRTAKRPIAPDRQRFLITVLVAALAAGVAEDILYGIVPAKTAYIAVPISILSYCILIGTIAATRRFYTSSHDSSKE